MHHDRRLAADMDRVLGALPAEFLVAGDDTARLVVGPTGAVVLVPTPNRGPGMDQAAGRALALATLTRRALCEHLTIVPFLETMLVADNRSVRHGDVVVASVDILGVALTEGNVVISRPALTAIALALRSGRVGAWVLPPRAADARIDLCETSPAAAPSSAA